MQFESETVDGTTILNCTFGRYEVEIYTGGIKLNGTTIDLFKNRSLLVKCEYYGLTVRIEVNDFFGQPIPNVNVTLQREGLLPYAAKTGSDGAVIFADFIGGDTNTCIYLNGHTQPYIKRNSHVRASSTLGIKIDKYVLIVGILVETSHLVTALIIIAYIITILVIEVYRRRNLEPVKASS